MKLTAILVDDEEKAIESLALKISRFFPEIEITNKFQNPQEAVTYLNKNPTDILYLDVEMPVLSGFDVLSKIDNPDFQVIFVTAYNNYAIEAFKNCAIGYFLKPIDNEELIATTKLAIKNCTHKNELKTNKTLLERLINSSPKTEKIAIPTTKGMSFINKSNIIQFEGYQGYTKIHLLDTTVITSSYNLGKFEKILCSNFYKCHKSHIVNLEKVQHFESEGYLILENNIRIPVSKLKRKEFIALFSK